MPDCAAAAQGAGNCTEELVRDVQEPRPDPPRVVLKEEFLKPLGMDAVALAKRMAVPIQRIKPIVTGKRGVTADIAPLLAEVFGTSREFWMNLQNRHDQWEAKKKRAKKVG